MRIDFALAARFLLLAWIIPASLSYMVYFGFASNISGRVFSEAGFDAAYSHGILKYRVLGPALLRVVHTAVNVIGLPTYAPDVLVRSDASLSPAFYSAFFYLNTSVQCLAVCVLFAFVRRFASATPWASDLSLLVAIGLMALSQYVVVPYDMLSYLFLAIAVYLTCAGPLHWWRFAALCVVVVLATLTRETAALILAFYFAAHFDALVWPAPSRTHTLSHRVALAVLVACFLSVYAGLRLWLGLEEATYHTLRLRQNFTENFSLVGGLFFAAAAALVLLHSRARRTSTLFLAASAPYWGAMYVVANPREVRLWVPVLFPLLLIQLVDDSRSHGDTPADIPSR